MYNLLNAWFRCIELELTVYSGSDDSRWKVLVLSPVAEYRFPCLFEESSGCLWLDSDGEARSGGLMEKFWRGANWHSRCVSRSYRNSYSRGVQATCLWTIGPAARDPLSHRSYVTCRNSPLQAKSYLQAFYVSSSWMTDCLYTVRTTYKVTPN